MDGRTRYNKICELLKPLLGQTFHMDKIRRRIMIDIGTSEQVITETMRLMIDLGLIRETKAYFYKVENCKADIDGE